MTNGEVPVITNESILFSREQLLNLIVSAEREKANLLLGEIAVKLGYRAVIDTILQPVLIILGELWSREDITLAQGYVAGKIAEDTLDAAHCSADFRKTISSGSSSVAVLGNIEDDFHAFGRKMVTTFLRLAGWTVHDLGCDVTAAEFVDRALETGARIIGVSSMIYTTAENIHKVRHEIDKRNLTGNLMLAVGGAVFNYRPQLVQQVGGDGTAYSAMEAPALFDALLARSLADSPACSLDSSGESNE
ncbi:MAG: corrinoid-binding protein [Candidatus Wallbacteria bacterium HGW-Wallbacteria-1]|jgi:methanogenic corrinoid protein MtbC1|uniref:Corrinoid-binding protein n=1 Tax=Candidatus Wallbacteria bacterium HGW-Wallbacteria-1 TaxID=2013854 RepID=A0A2N1PKZ2_9BACT|nr:MAG: corrinoid-binding protein [Candidatus Wallbacteria bacterium HGW-Wallbacteria-1]